MNDAAPIPAPPFLEAQICDSCRAIAVERARRGQYTITFYCDHLPERTSGTLAVATAEHGGRIAQWHFTPMSQLDAMKRGGRELLPLSR